MTNSCLANITAEPLKNELTTNCLIGALRKTRNLKKAIRSVQEKGTDSFEARKVRLIKNSKIFSNFLFTTFPKQKQYPS